MAQAQATGRGEVQRQGSVLVDAMLYNGVDRLAVRRAHMRELTTARQAAERRSTWPALPAGRDGWEQRVAARERTVELRAHLARLQEEHRTWLHAQGEDVRERRTRRRTVPGTAQS